MRAHELSQYGHNYYQKQGQKKCKQNENLNVCLSILLLRLCICILRQCPSRSEDALPVFPFGACPTAFLVHTLRAGAGVLRCVYAGAAGLCIRLQILSALSSTTRQRERAHTLVCLTCVCCHILYVLVAIFCEVIVFYFKMARRVYVHTGVCNHCSGIIDRCGGAFVAVV